MHWLYLLVVVVIVAWLRLATCGRVATRHIVIFLVAGLLLATLRGLHVATSLIINYSLWRHICVRKGRGRGPGRKRGQGARQRSTADYREKRQRRHEGLWQEGWAGGWDDKDESSQWRNDDDSWNADDSWAADESWGAWECLECVNVNLFVSVSVRVVTHMWQGCDSSLVAGLRLATRGRVATRHLWQGCDSPHMLHKHDDINCVRAMIPVNRQQCTCIHLMQR